MLTVTDAFQAAILPGTTAIRRTAARVTLNVSESTIEYDTFTAVESEAAFSDVTKVTDGTADNTYRIATCEPNYWKLDGSTVFKPAVTIDVGYASLALCAADGTFTADPAVQITTTADFTAKGITLFFDRLSGDYPIDFDIDVDYSVTPVNVYHKAVTGNDSAYYILDDDINPNTDPVDTITITFKKMNKGYRRARLSELFMGFQQQYGAGGSGDMLSIATTQQIDPYDATLPSGQAVLRLSNAAGTFNPISPDGIAQDLQAGSDMTVEFGVYTSPGVVEYVKIGKYLFSEWRDAGGKVVELIGLDAIGYYGDTPVSNLYPGWTKAESPRFYIWGIINATNIPLAIIDGDSIPLTGEFLSGQSRSTFREELLSVAQWMCKVPVCDETGIIRFVDINTQTDHYVYLNDCYDYPVIDRLQDIGGVDVNIYNTTSAAADETICTYVEDITGVKNVYLQISQDWGNLAVAVDGEVSYSELEYSHGIILVQVTGSGATVTITVTGKRTSIATATYSLDNPMATDTTLNRVKIDNMHIYTEDKANEVATFTLYNYLFLIKINASFRGSPAVEMGDVVDVETAFLEKDINVTRQDIMFDGTMSATMEGVG